MLLGLQLLGLSENAEFPQALWDVASSLVLDDHGHEDVHQNESQELRDYLEDDKALPAPEEVAEKKFNFDVELKDRGTSDTCVQTYMCGLSLLNLFNNLCHSRSLFPAVTLKMSYTII